MSPSIPDPTGTVVLCGSVTRAVDALNAAERHYLAEGYTVHKPVRNDGVAFELHVDRWYQLIDAADVVVACAMQGDYVGEQTRREMERAFTADAQVHLWIEPAAPKPRQWTADDCNCNDTDDCYGDPDQETSPDSPWYRFCPYCHYVGGLCPGREERAS